MNYLDLTLVAVVSWCIYRATRRGWRESLLGFARDIAAVALALLIQGKVVALLWTTRMTTTITKAFEAGLTVPTGPGSTAEGVLRWLKETDLPEALSEAIRYAWQRDPSADVKALSQAAAHVLARATLNLACFIALFILIRWLLNLVSHGVAAAIPAKSVGRHRAMGVVMGIIQSILVCAILVAILAPLAATAMLPAVLADHFRHSRLVSMLGLMLRYFNFYGV